MPLVFSIHTQIERIYFCLVFVFPNISKDKRREDPWSPLYYEFFIKCLKKIANVGKSKKESYFQKSFGRTKNAIHEEPKRRFLGSKLKMGSDYIIY